MQLTSVAQLVLNTPLFALARTREIQVETYLTSEQHSLALLKDNLDIEISNISSNTELADKYFTETVEWEDVELLDAKQNYLRTVEFIRNFDCEAHDYNRRIKLVLHQDPGMFRSGEC